MQGFFVESPYVRAINFVLILPSVAKLGKGEPGFSIEKLPFKMETRFAQSRTMPGFKLAH